jgi:putative transposase
MRLDVKKRFTGKQIIGFLRNSGAGLTVAELCRRHGFSQASKYLWRRKCGGMKVCDVKRLKELEAKKPASETAGRCYPGEKGAAGRNPVSTSAFMPN